VVGIAWSQAHILDADLVDGLSLCNPPPEPLATNLGWGSPGLVCQSESLTAVCWSDPANGTMHRRGRSYFSSEQVFCSLVRWGKFQGQRYTNGRVSRCPLVAAWHAHIVDGPTLGLSIVAPICGSLFTNTCISRYKSRYTNLVTSRYYDEDCATAIARIQTTVLYLYSPIMVLMNSDVYQGGILLIVLHGRCLVTNREFASTTYHHCYRKYSNLIFMYIVQIR
jgi:hypothetical protein